MKNTPTTTTTTTLASGKSETVSSIRSIHLPTLPIQTRKGSCGLPPRMIFAMLEETNHIHQKTMLFSYKIFSALHCLTLLRCCYPPSLSFHTEREHGTESQSAEPLFYDVCNCEL
mmetsp:Transcript_2036/g.4172  ORF Transcript_2036/g.4172 Transcript_2036/m.4172 type:complete len:115 (+) Transcript_2036:46-390(+)